MSDPKSRFPVTVMLLRSQGCSLTDRECRRWVDKNRGPRCTRRRRSRASIMDENGRAHVAVRRGPDVTYSETSPREQPGELRVVAPRRHHRARHGVGDRAAHDVELDPGVLGAQLAVLLGEPAVVDRRREPRRVDRVLSGLDPASDLPAISS